MFAAWPARPWPWFPARKQMVIGRRPVFNDRAPYLIMKART